MHVRPAAHPAPAGPAARAGEPGSGHHIAITGLGHVGIGLAHDAVAAGHRTTVLAARPDRFHRLVGSLAEHDEAAATLHTAIDDGRCRITTDPAACASCDIVLICPELTVAPPPDDPVEQAAVAFAAHLRPSTLVVIAVPAAASAAAERFASATALLTGGQPGADYRLGLILTGGGSPTIVSGTAPVAAERTARLLEELGKRALAVSPESAECVASLLRILPPARSTS